MKARNVGNTAYPATFTLSDKNGTVDLTGATVTMKMTNIAGVVKTYSACTVLNQTTNRGQARYDWTAGDVDTVGVFYIKVYVVFSNGKTATWPTKNPESLEIRNG